jgi:hypothetical protein
VLIDVFKCERECAGCSRLEREIAKCHTPRLTRREISAREWDIAQVRSASVNVEIRHERFSAPHVTIVAKSRSIESQTNDRRRDAILCGHRCDVRVVMLHDDRSLEAKLLRNTGGEIPGMQVAHCDLGLDPEEILVSRESSAEMIETFDAVQIPNVRADVSGIATHEREGVLQMRPCCKQSFRRRDRQPQCQWSVTASAAHDERCSFDHSCDRVIDARKNVAIMQQEHIGNVPQSHESLEVPCRYGLLAQIPARHYQRPCNLVEQQSVKGRICQHYANAIKTWCNGRSKRCVRCSLD